MATSAGAVQLDLTANTKRFEQSSSAAISKMRSKGQAAVGGLTSAIGKMGSAFGVALVGAGLTKFSMDCAQAAASAQDTANRVSTVFPEMAASVNAFAADAREKLGMGAGSAKRLTTQFGMMAQGMGYTEKASAGMGEQMTKLAGDMAAFYGISADEAASKLTGVFTGMTRGLKQLGVNMSEANLQAHALSIGMQGDVKSMGDAELAALRLSYAQAQLAKTDGYAQRRLGTYGGQVQLLQQRFDALKSTLGKGVAAALVPLLKGLNAIMQAAINAANAINAMIERITGKKLSDMLGGAAGAVVDLGEETEEAAGSTAMLAAEQEQATAAADAQRAAQERLNRAIAGFDRINRLSSRNDDGIQTVETPELNPANVVGGLPEATQAFEGFAEAAEAAGAAVSAIQLPEGLVAAFEGLKRALDGFAEVVRGGVSWAWENVLKPLGEWTMNELAPRVVELVSGAFEVLGRILDALYPVWDALFKSVIKPLAEFLGEVFCVALDLVNDALDVLADIITDYVKPAMEVLGEFINRTLGPAFNWLKDILVGALKGAVQWLSDRFEAMAPYAEKLAKAVGEALSDALDWLAGTLEDLAPYLRDAAEWVGDKLAKAFDWLGGRIDEAWPVIEKAAKVVGEKLKEAAEVAAPVVKDVLGKAFEAVSTAAGWLWEHVLVPFGTFLADTFAGKNKTANAAVDAMAKAFDAVKTAAKWVWDNLLVPFGTFLADTFAGKNKAANAAVDAMAKAFDAVKSAAGWVWEKVLVPFGSFLVDTFNGKNEAANAVVDAMATAFDGVKTAAGWVWEHVLAPLGTFLADVFAGKNEVANGILKAMAGFFEAIGKAAQLLWDNVLAPFGGFMADVFAGKNETVNGILEAMAGFFGAIGDAAKWVWDNVLSPFGAFLGDTFGPIVEGVGGFIEDVGRQLGLIPQDKSIEISVGSKPVDKFTADLLDKVYGIVQDAKDKVQEVAVELAARAKEDPSYKAVVAELNRLEGSTKEAFLKAAAKTKSTDVKEIWANVSAPWKDKASKFTVNSGATKTSEVSSNMDKRATLWNSRLANFTIDSKKTTTTVIAADSKARKDKWTGKSAVFSINSDVTKAAEVQNSYIARSKYWHDKTNDFWLSTNKTTDTDVKQSWQRKANVWNPRGVDFWVYTNATPEDTVKNKYKKYLSYWKDTTAHFGIEATGIEGKVENGKVFFTQLKALAHGAVFKRNSPELVVVGDNTSEGEIVAPESKMMAMADRAAKGATSVQVVRVLESILAAVQGIDPNTYLDGQELTRAVVGNINRQTQQTGRSPILV